MIGRQGADHPGGDAPADRVSRGDQLGGAAPGSDQPACLAQSRGVRREHSHDPVGRHTLLRALHRLVQQWIGGDIGGTRLRQDRLDPAHRIGGKPLAHAVQPGLLCGQAGRERQPEN